MAVYVVVCLPIEQTEALVVDAFEADGFEKKAGSMLGPRRRLVGIDVYALGCVVKFLTGPLAQFAGCHLERKLGEGIDAGFSLTQIVEWDEAGRTVRELRHPDWAAQRRYDNGTERIARRHLNRSPAPVSVRGRGGRRSGCLLLEPPGGWMS